MHDDHDIDLPDADLVDILEITASALRGAAESMRLAIAEMHEAGTLACPATPEGEACRRVMEAGRARALEAVRTVLQMADDIEPDALLGEVVS